MRYLSLICLVLLAAACGGNNQKSATARQGFAGTWTSIVDTTQEHEPGYRDTLHFGTDSNFYIRIYNADGLLQETRGTYRYDTAHKALITMAPTGNKSFYVPQYTGDTLYLNDGEGGEMRIRRIGNK
ncbi:MAG: hypothetical protein EOO11_18875 [Chitinophagaceae bacterium]|nr:MAG: hypothetical protein EOO11_18875 [Chitinophagaceae bacterium]